MLKDRPKLAAAELMLRTRSSSIHVFRYQLVDATVIWKSSTYEDVNVSVCSPSGCRDLTYIMNSKGDSGDP